MAEMITLWSICGFLMALSAITGLLTLFMMIRSGKDKDDEGLFFLPLVATAGLLIAAAIIAHQGAVAWDKLHAGNVVEGK